MKYKKPKNKRLLGRYLIAFIAIKYNVKQKDVEITHDFLSIDMCEIGYKIKNTGKFGKLKIKLIENKHSK